MPPFGMVLKAIQELDLGDLESPSVTPHSYVHACPVAQLYLALCDPMDCNLPGCSVHRIFQAGILERVAISYFGAALLVCGYFFDPLRIGQPLIFWQVSKQVRFRNE